MLQRIFLRRTKARAFVLLAGAALIMLGFSVPALAYTQNDTFVIGSVHKKKGKVKGSQAYLTTPNTGALFVPRHESMTYAATDGHFVLVEAGAYENNGTLYNPYTKWIDANGIEHFWSGNDDLFPGGWYLYRVHMWETECGEPSGWMEITCGMLSMTLILESFMG